MKVNKLFHKMPLKFWVGVAVVLSSLLCVAVAVNKKSAGQLRKTIRKSSKILGNMEKIYPYMLISLYPRLIRVFSFMTMKTIRSCRLQNAPMAMVEEARQMCRNFQMSVVADVHV